MITIIEIGITSVKQLITVETEKKRKYDILATHLGPSSQNENKNFSMSNDMKWDSHQNAQ